MANIATEIKNFLSAIYGKDVRASLVSMAEKLNYEVENNTTVAKNAANSANEAASNANEAAANANEATERANTAASEAEDAAINANEAAEKVKNLSVVELEEEVAQVKSDLTKYLPKDGSVPMSGNILEFFGGFGNIYADNSSIMLQILKTIGGKEQCKLALRNSLYTGGSVAHALAFINQLADGTSTEYKIYGEHNKPSGSYIGNGEAAERTFNIGGTGRYLIFDGYGRLGIVTSSGGVVWGIGDGTTENFTGDKMKFHHGILTLASESSKVNANGQTYQYYVL